MLPSGYRAARLPLARLLSIYVDVVGNRSPIAIAIAGDGPSYAEASALVPTSTYALPTRDLPGTPPPGHDSYRISRRMASRPRKPGGRDLAEVALSGPPMTHPDTIRPHEGPK